MIRNRIALLLGTLAILIVPAASATGASAATVELRKTAEGEVLTDSAGFTLFMYTLDRARMEHCQSVMGCTSVWPPVFAEGAPTAGPGVNAAKLGTVMLSNGSQQVTYKHHPLYEYIGDKNPEETFYVGAFAFAGYWFAMNAEGHKVGHRKKPAA